MPQRTSAGPTIAEKVRTQVHHLKPANYFLSASHLCSFNFSWRRVKVHDLSLFGLNHNLLCHVVAALLTYIVINLCWLLAIFLLSWYVKSSVIFSLQPIRQSLSIPRLWTSSSLPWILTSCSLPTLTTPHFPKHGYISFHTYWVGTSTTI